MNRYIEETVQELRLHSDPTTLSGHGTHDNDIDNVYIIMFFFKFIVLFEVGISCVCSRFSRDILTLNARTIIVWTPSL